VGSGNSGGLIPEILDYVRPANPPLLAFGGVIDMDHRDFFGQALHGAQPDPGQTGHLGVGMTRLKQNLDFVTLQHSNHPPPSAQPV